MNPFEILLQSVLPNNKDKTIPLLEGWQFCIEDAIRYSYKDDNETLSKFIPEFVISHWVRSLKIWKENK